jgi:4-cresol dehydrogenase (hydroxylating)
MWFGPLVPLDGQTVVELMDLYRKKFRDYQFDCYITILMLNARTVVPLFGIIYRPEDAEERDRAVTLYHWLVDDALSRGYQQFRCSRLGWDSVFKSTPDILAFHERIKDALDPHHIIAPGKYGIF